MDRTADLAAFVVQHQSTIVNALQVHARRMREAAAEAPTRGYMKLFTDEAEQAEAVARDLAEVLGRLPAEFLRPL